MRLRFVVPFVSIVAVPAGTVQAFCPPACPVIHVYPNDPAPCDGASTLQACIDSVNPGDEVLLETNGPIDESPTIDKSLTLAAASGFTPVFSDGHSIFVGLADPVASRIDISGLTLEGGIILVAQQGAGSLSADVTHDTIVSSASGGPAVEVRGSGQPAGAITFDVSANAITAPLGNDSVGIRVDPGSASGATGQIAHNAIEMQGSTQGSGIELFGYQGDLQADVIANRVSGTSYNHGIYVQVEAAGSAETRILDNLVSGQGGNAGAPGGIVFYAIGPIAATVVNNTVVDGDIGILPAINGSGSITGLLANNLVADNTRFGFDVGPDVETTLANENDLAFGDGAEFLTPGPGTVMADPLFVGSGDYHLQSGSPAIDAGDASAVPMDLATDLDGNPRIQGASVDIGAFEAPEPGGVPAAASSLAALALLARRRRRPRSRATLASSAG